MITHSPVPVSDSPVCMLRWLLRSGAAVLSCEVGMNGDRTFEVRVLPSSNQRDGLVERYSGLVSAMKRHAEIANTLRDSGWQVAERITAPAVAA